MRHKNESYSYYPLVQIFNKIVTFFMEHMIVDFEKTIERDQEARQVKEVKEKLFGRMGAAMGISPFGII